MRQALIAAVLLVSAATAGWMIAPPAWQALRALEAGPDPADFSDIDPQVQSTLTAERAAQEIDAALAAEDDELAASFLELAGDADLPADAVRQERLAALRANGKWRALRDFGSGLAFGDGDSGAAMAGALTADVAGYGDLRDLYKEGGKALAGQDADLLVIGLAAAGLAVSAATWTSVGAALPVRSGLTLVKTTQKAGRLSKPLVAALTRSASTAVDRQALTVAVTAAGRFELAAAWRAATGILRPSTLTTFKTLGQDTATLYTRTGQRGARQVLALAHSNAEVTRAAKLAVVKGGKTRAILTLLGRGALVAAALSLTAAGWLFSFVWYLLALAMLVRRFGVWLGRKVWPRRAGAAPARPSERRKSRHFPGAGNDVPLLGA